LMTGWFVFFLIAAFHLDTYLPRHWQAPLGLVILLVISGWITLSTRTDLSGLQIGPEGTWNPVAAPAGSLPGRRLILRDTFLSPARAPDQSNIREGLGQ
jgi:hypothetical protein